MDILISKLADTIREADLMNDYELSSRLHLAGLNDSINFYSGNISPDYFDFRDSEFR